MSSAHTRSLKKQFLILVGLAIALVIFFESFGIVAVVKLNRHSQQLSKNKFDVLVVLNKLENVQSDFVLYYLQQAETSVTTSVLNDFNDRFTTYLNSTRVKLTAAEEPHIRAIEISWQALFNMVINQPTKNLNPSFNATNEQLDSHLNVLRQTTLVHIERDQSDTHANIRNAILYILAGAILGIGLAAWLVMRLVGRFSDGLHTLGQAMAVTAAGDLTRQVSIGGCSEMEALSEGFNYMVAELEEQSQEIVASEQGLLAVMNSAPDAIITTDLEGKILSWNDAAVRLFVYKFEEIDGEIFQSILEPSQQAEFMLILSEYRQDNPQDEKGSEAPREFSVRRKDGIHVPVELTLRKMLLDEEKKIVVVGRDITERKANEEKMAFLTQHDNLTHLPNRSLIRELLIQAMGRADSKERLVGVITLGISKFSDINDQFGHTLADGLLVNFSERINDTLSRRDHFGRIGGDEFCIIIDSMRNVGDASKLAELISAKFSQPFRLGGQEVYVNLCMGIAIYPFDDESPEILLKHASAAMYRCKRDERQIYLFYADEMNTISSAKVKLFSELKHALENNQFQLYYQPQFDIQTNRLVGAEALLRWSHPELGLLLPVDFISILEETGLIVEVGRWVLSEACKIIMLWNHEDNYPFRVSINLSARQFMEDEFIGHVQSAVNILKSGLQGKGINLSSDSDIKQYLEFELTEGVLMENTEASCDMLFALKEMGIKLSVDDFGTGYSSLSYLQQFPLDALKIDQSFVKGIGLSQSAELIVHAIIDLAHNLRLHVVGEGVETQQHLEFLRDKNCDEAQGYLFSKPLPADEFENLLVEYNDQAYMTKAE